MRSLRCYEEQGLLTSVRSSGAQRHYRDADVERVRLLQRLYAAGLSSRTIAAVLPCVDAPSANANDDAYARLVAERDSGVVGVARHPARDDDRADERVGHGSGRGARDGRRAGVGAPVAPPEALAGADRRVPPPGRSPDAAAVGRRCPEVDEVSGGETGHAGVRPGRDDGAPLALDGQQAPRAPERRIPASWGVVGRPQRRPLIPRRP